MANYFLYRVVKISIMKKTFFTALIAVCLVSCGDSNNKSSAGSEIDTSTTNGAGTTGTGGASGATDTMGVGGGSASGTPTTVSPTPNDTAVRSDSGKQGISGADSANAKKSDTAKKSKKSTKAGAKAATDSPRP